jgi:hypothetical protein
MSDYSAYFDVSGHPADKPYLVLAGYVSSETKWLAFEGAWNQTLDELGIEKPFHMTDFMKLMEGKEWEWEREQKLKRLSETINTHTEGNFISAIDMTDYKKLNEEFFLEEAMGAPYALAGRVVVVVVEKWRSANLSADDRLLLFVEEGTHHRGDLEQVFKRDGIPTPIPVPKSLPAVQPADLLAWEANYRLSHPEEQLRANLSRLFSPSNPRCLGTLASEQDLRALSIGEYGRRRGSLPDGTTIRFHSEPKRIRIRKIF